jgi:hypothetical protein
MKDDVLWIQMAWLAMERLAEFWCVDAGRSKGSPWRKRGAYMSIDFALKDDEAQERWW